MSINIKPSHEGRLHKRLHVPKGQKIPESKIKSAEDSSDPSLRKEAQFADNAKHFRHGARHVRKK